MRIHNAQASILSSVKNCYIDLYGYLKQHINGYSYELALKWLEGKSHYCEGYQRKFKYAVERLNHVFRYGKNLDTYITKIPKGASHLDCLPIQLNEQYDKFLSDVSKTRVSVTMDQIKPMGLRILLNFYLNYSIDDLSQIKYDMVIKCYHEGLNPTIKNMTLHLLLDYLYRTHILSYGFSIIVPILRCRNDSCWYRLNDSAMKRISDIAQFDREDRIFVSLDKYLEIIQNIETKLLEMHYQENALYDYKHIYKLLYLFLDYNCLEYNKEIAFVWEENFIQNRDGNLKKKAIRAILMIENTLDIKIRFPSRKSRYMQLPQWCKLAIDDYLNGLHIQGRKESTLTSKRNDLTHFCMYLVDKKLVSLSDITVQLLKDYNLSDAHVSPAGKNLRNCTIKRFIQYLEQKKVCRDRIHLAIPTMYAPSERLVVTLTENDALNLNKAIDVQNENSKLILRDKVIIMLAYKMGLRACDIVNLTFKNILFESDEIQFVQQKTGVEVKLPMPAEVSDALYKYLLTRRNDVSCNYIFLREMAPFTKLCSQACRLILKKALPDREAKGTGFHITRKTFATNLIKNGATLEQTAALLGHRGIKTVHKYVSLDEAKMIDCALSLTDQDLLFKGEFR